MILFAEAQQVGMVGHGFFKPMINNPAFTGHQDLNAMIISRSQWTDFNGAPQLNLFTLDGNLLNKKVGLGLSLISDRKGITHRIGGYLNYSYRLNINDDTYLMFGVSAGVIDQSIDYSKALVEDPSDPFLFYDVQRKTSFDANAGLAFIWKDLEFGLSALQLAGNRINYVDNTNVRTYYTQARHYSGTLKYKVFISREKEISIAPVALVRFIPNAPFQYDGSLIMEWKDKFWIGGTYKSDYAVAANVGICLHKQLSVGYSYDFIIGSIGKYSGMSHEIMINYKFGNSKKDDKETNEAISKIAVKNEMNEKRLDSLQNELSSSQDKIREDQRKIKENQDKINELNNKLDQQAKVIEQTNSNINSQNSQVVNDQNKIDQGQSNSNTQLQQNQNNQQQQPKNNGNQNSAAVAGNADKVLDSGVWVVTNKTRDFKDENDHVPQKGFYVIAGTFFYKDFAQNEMKRLKNQGFKGANYVYFEPKQFNYVFITRENTKEAALKKVNEAKAAGIKDAWIQMLVD